MKRPRSAPLRYCLALLLTPSLCAALEAANCTDGPPSPRASASYTVSGNVRACGSGAAGYSVEIHTRITTTYTRIRDAEIIDIVTTNRRLGTRTTNSSGNYSFTFDWCSAIAPHIPGLRAGTVRGSGQSLWVRIVPPRGTPWTSPTTALSSTNSIVQNHSFSLAEVDCEPDQPGAPPILEVLTPDNGAVYSVDVCPFPVCNARFPVAVSIDATSTVQRVDRVIRRADGSVHHEGVLCVLDPIEQISCGTSSPDFDAVQIDNHVLPEGEFTVTYTAFDFFGQTGSAVLEVEVVDNLGPPPGPTRIDSIDPFAGASALLLRQGANPLRTSADTITIRGSNLHQFHRVYLVPRSFSPRRSDWIRYEAVVLTVAPDGTELRFLMPDLPARTQTDINSEATGDTFGIGWRVELFDRWIRPGHTFSTYVPDPNVSVPESEMFRIERPEYPLVYGFGFDNEHSDTGLDEFLAVYGRNAYMCGGVGIGGACIGVRVPNPLYWVVWLPVFKLWLDSADGSCVGMSATSIQMRDGDLDPRDFDADVLFPAGFDESISREAEWRYDSLLGPVTGPPVPVNLWAHIRQNHGCQTSGEYLREVIADLTSLEPPFFGGDPVGRLNQIRSDPLGQVVCMLTGSKGHCVLPYRVEDQGHGADTSAIRIYDNNEPRSPSRVIEIDRRRNRYDMTHHDDYQGDAIITAPKRIFQEGRNMPGLDLADDLLLLTFGDADALVTSSAGERFGRLADGSLVQEIPTAVPITPIGGVDTEIRNLPLVLPRELRGFDVAVDSTGGDYTFHAAQGGRAVQLAVSDVRDGETDSVRLEYLTERLASLCVETESSRSAVVPRVGTTLSETESVVFTWAGIGLANGGEHRFTVLSDTIAVEYENDSSRAGDFRLVVDAADGEAESRSVHVFGPFRLPAGACQRATIVDWPAAQTLRCDVDLDGDGEFDVSEMVGGQTCGGSEDVRIDSDGDGFPDECASARELFRRGDCNADGRLNLSDAQCTLDFLFRGVGDLACVDAADANDDGRLDLSDAVFKLAFLFLGGPAPSAPGSSECGADPTSDALSCGRSPACP